MQDLVCTVLAGLTRGVTDDDRIRTGRVQRAVPIARLAARTAAARLGGKVRKGDEQKQLDRFTREAERYVAVLGDMKGVAMKVGQLLSFLDTASIPEQYRGAYQQIIGALQANAPPMPFETVLAVIERELGRPADEVFEWIGEQPMAAASIGQVHAAHLPDGREVVVKVQYPGVGGRDPGGPRQHRARSRRSRSSGRSSPRSAFTPTRPPSRTRSPSGSAKSSTTASRPPTRSSSPTTTGTTPSSGSLRSSPSCRPSGCWSWTSTTACVGRLPSTSPRSSGTRGARSSTGSCSARYTTSASSTPTRTPATTSSTTTAPSRSSTSAA